MTWISFGTQFEKQYIYRYGRSIYIRQLSGESAEFRQTSIG
jgi:hypothetical protein